LHTKRRSNRGLIKRMTVRIKKRKRSSMRTKTRSVIKKRTKRNHHTTGLHPVSVY